MRFVDGYAIAAALVTLAATVWMLRARKVRGPSRGFGAAYAAIFISAVWGAGVLHGLIVCAVAIATGATPISWICAALHAVVVAVYLRR